MKAIPESAKVCWIFARFSVNAVMNVAHYALSLPTGLTESQHNQRIADCARLSVKGAEFIGDFIRMQCPSFLTGFKGGSFEKLLGPSTCTCYECGSSLVKYHECRVRCYSTSGFKLANKVTSRCLKCSQFYNYAQFGNKQKLGFCFYPEPREYIEANDAVLVYRKLFEFQCCLA